MHNKELRQLVEQEAHLLGYFDQQVLASYRNEPDKYAISSDEFEGTLTVTEGYYKRLEEQGRTDEYLKLLFGYRSLADGELCVVVWLPHLQKALEHHDRWLGLRRKNPEWPERDDERFFKWVARYLGGSWEVDNGPKHYLIETMDTINGLTKEVTGVPFYEHRIDDSLAFPAAENTHRYQDAHLILYGYLIDGISKECLTKLALRAGDSRNFNGNKTLEAVSKLLPQLDQNSKFTTAMQVVSEQRGKAAHGVRPKAEIFAAFSAFTRDLKDCLQGLRGLLAALEGVLNVDGKAATQRIEAKAMLPIIERPVHEFASIRQISQTVGKTVEKVDYGLREDIENVHGSEAFVIHFTDGTIVGIDTGSNAFNVATGRNDLQPEDFTADFNLTWVPALTRDKSK